MARKEVTGNWTRDDRIAINENFRKLFEEYVGAGLDAAEAKEKAIQAVADSLYAKETAETTRDELTRIIREQTAGGDVVPEVVQARGTHNTVGERLNSISQDLAQTEEIVSFLESHVQNKKIPVLTPEKFDWKDHPLRGKIFTDGKGNFEIVDFDVARLQPVGKTYYVDVSQKDDSGDGLTPGTAFKRLTTALNQPDVTVIMMAGGAYDRNNGFTPNDVVTKPIAIKAIPGHKVILASTQYIVWSKTSGRQNVYQSTTGNANMLLDTMHMDDNGDYRRLSRVNSIDAVESNPGSYYHDGSNVYIHTYDSRPADDYIWRFTGSNHVRVQGGGLLYLEGIDVYEGNTPVVVEKTEENKTPVLYAKNCSFKYSGFTSTNVVDLKGSFSILQNCVAAKGTKDGFYYVRSMGQGAIGLEINCVGRDNGLDGSSSDQGSTLHSGCRVIRINSAYYNNAGANIGDDSSNGEAQSWNLGLKNHGSRAANPLQNANFMAYGGTKMFLDGCVGFDSTYDVSGEGEVYVNNNHLLSATKFDDRTTVIEY